MAHCTCVAPRGYTSTTPHCALLHTSCAVSGPAAGGTGVMLPHAAQRTFCAPCTHEGGSHRQHRSERAGRRSTERFARQPAPRSSPPPIPTRERPVRIRRARAARAGSTGSRNAGDPASMRWKRVPNERGTPDGRPRPRALPRIGRPTRRGPLKLPPRCRCGCSSTPLARARRRRCVAVPGGRAAVLCSPRTRFGSGRRLRRVRAVIGGRVVNRRY